MDLLVTFPSVHAALAAERALRGQGLAVELIPLPRQIRADCGFCLLATGGPDSGPDWQQLQQLGGRERWRVLETQASPSSRKVKHYERYP